MTARTFSSSVRIASFFFAERRVSLSNSLFCGGLEGGENSVFGVELELLMSLAIIDRAIFELESLVVVARSAVKL